MCLKYTFHITSISRPSSHLPHHTLLPHHKCSHQTLPHQTLLRSHPLSHITPFLPLTSTACTCFALHPDVLAVVAIVLFPAVVGTIRDTAQVVVSALEVVDPDRTCVDRKGQRQSSHGWDGTINVRACVCAHKCVCTSVLHMSNVTIYVDVILL